MIYTAQVDHGGTARVYSYKSLQYFLSVAGSALDLETHEKSIHKIDEAGKARYAFFEIFATEWHAAQRIKSSRLPLTVAALLIEKLDRAQIVGGRAYAGKCGPE